MKPEEFESKLLNKPDETGREILDRGCYLCGVVDKVPHVIEKLAQVGIENRFCNYHGYAVDHNKLLRFALFICRDNAGASGYIDMVKRLEELILRIPISKR